MTSSLTLMNYLGLSLKCSVSRDVLQDGGIFTGGVVLSVSDFPLSERILSL